MTIMVVLDRLAIRGVLHSTNASVRLKPPVLRQATMHMDVPPEQPSVPTLGSVNIPVRAMQEIQ